MVKVGTMVDFEGHVFRVMKVFCKVERTMAFVEIVREDNQDIQTYLPSLLVKLNENDREDPMNMPDMLSDVQQIFLIYGAIKRAISITARSKSNHIFSLLPATPVVQNIVGIKRDNVVCTVF